MSNEALIALIEQLPMILTALASLVAAILTFLMRGQVTTLKEHVNSKMDMLLDETKKASNLEGQLTGRIEGQKDAAITAEITLAAVKEAALVLEK